MSIIPALDVPVKEGSCSSHSPDDATVGPKTEVTPNTAYPPDSLTLSTASSWSSTSDRDNGVPPSPAADASGSSASTGEGESNAAGESSGGAASIGASALGPSAAGVESRMAPSVGARAAPSSPQPYTEHAARHASKPSTSRVDTISHGSSANGIQTLRFFDAKTGLEHLG